MKNEGTTEKLTLLLIVKDEAEVVADLLARRPDLGEILALPPGTLVVMNGGAIESVIDVHDNPVRLAASGQSE